jgi:hypothetical protein
MDKPLLKVRDTGERWNPKSSGPHRICFIVCGGYYEDTLYEGDFPGGTIPIPERLYHKYVVEEA